MDDATEAFAAPSGPVTAWTALAEYYYAPDHGFGYRMKGGRTIYDAVGLCADRHRNDSVLFMRLDASGEYLHQVNRRVHPDALVEIIQNPNP